MLSFCEVLGARTNTITSELVPVPIKRVIIADEKVCAISNRTRDSSGEQGCERLVAFASPDLRLPCRRVRTARTTCRRRDGLSQEAAQLFQTFSGLGCGGARHGRVVAGGRLLRTLLLALGLRACARLVEQRLLLEHDQQRRVEHFLQVLLRQRRALDVRHRTDVARELPRRILRHGLVTVLVELDQYFDVVAQVALRADQQQWRVGAVRAQFGQPLLAHVVEGGGRHDREADEKDVGVRVAQRSQTVEVVLEHKQQHLIPNSSDIFWNFDLCGLQGRLRQSRGNPRITVRALAS